MFTSKIALLKRQWIEGYVPALSNENYLSPVFQKHRKTQVLLISKPTIGNVICKKEKIHHNLASERKKLPNTYQKKKRSSSNITKEKSLMLKESPPTQTYVVKYIKLLSFNRK